MFKKKYIILMCLTLCSSPDSFPPFPSAPRSVQSEADEVRGSHHGTPPGACAGTGGAGQVGHLRQIRVLRRSGEEEGHCGRQRPDCGHRGHSGLPDSVTGTSVLVSHSREGSHCEVLQLNWSL